MMKARLQFICDTAHLQEQTHMPASCHMILITTILAISTHLLSTHPLHVQFTRLPQPDGEGSEGIA